MKRGHTNSKIHGGGEEFNAVSSTKYLKVSAESKGSAVFKCPCKPRQCREVEGCEIEPIQAAKWNSAIVS